MRNLGIGGEDERRGEEVENPNKVCEEVPKRTLARTGHNSSKRNEPIGSSGKDAEESQAKTFVSFLFTLL